MPSQERRKGKRKRLWGSRGESNDIVRQGVMAGSIGKGFSFLGKFLDGREDRPSQ